MAGPSRSRRRSADYAWLITGPLGLFAFACTIGFWIDDPGWYRDALPALVILALYLVSQFAAFNVVIRRSGLTVTVTEVPLVLGLYYISPVLMIGVVVIGALSMQVRYTTAPVKAWFNVAKQAASICASLLVIEAFPPIVNAGPGTWGILAVAVAVNVLVQLACFAGVMSVVQGGRAAPDMLRASLPNQMIAGVNAAVGLLFLIALEATKWSAILLGVLAVALTLLLRSFAGFFRQHRTLADVYELTQALRKESSDSALPDVLLGRVRELMRSEYATLWLAPQDRYPEVLLTAQVDNKGLLDISPVPAVIRDHAIQEHRVIGVGSRFPETEHLRAELRSTRAKDVLVVPLRSGQTVIGTLEVVNRLGESRSFRDSDVQVLETIAAHAAATVENSRLVDRLRHDAYHDRLTGMPNRRRIVDALAESVRVHAEHEVVAVVLFDVDGQRNVNESMGHAAGDKLLSEVAARLRGIADSGALVGRIGGDEFVVTLRAESLEATITLATQMRERLRGPMAVGSLTLDVDTAVGVAVYPDHGSDPETLLQRAELAANAAKALPYGVQPFHPALESRAVRRLGIAADLRRALDNGQLEVYFQPMVTLADRHVVGVECLARWSHPAHGEVAPEDFVAVAEHTGQLARLTEVVLRAGLQRCRDWAAADRPLAIAVNLSARTLLDSRFPDLVEEMLTEYRVDPGQLTFEISEPGMLNDIERVLPTLYRLRDLGLRLSVDDFGTGASSLAYLRQWPVHEVKIDDTFVQGMATDNGDLAIVRAVVGLSREFGLTVVAEGVESELTLDLLEEMGCELGQGYLFSRPLPFERLEAWLSAQTEPESTPTGEVRRLRAVI
ncbi:putative cGMP-specific phosphodiesterase [Actinoplanes missouriensis 431]|uniref:Putative cGMP-specific phosphodiesterase n=1 Tax=Actinoplanes missouriensis (strain ATCC 14538 / DSM 43046 / CBS 188.64 / JCM 3121 / NBRC 102363 / NCIMB 12654 / NRRL B-3342 / UNCC 431) TaxID=512565 RepID=I0GYG6_ACTM4|nr:bifunctional diguanylate cyclase/phosphodiesterase [Actinoplanes missouriensis]BAL85803.1 putative cGMP-specific phosphodiesterase [Actinoplanes missouriensis 431]